jgi:hypothetical protein
MYLFSLEMIRDTCFGPTFLSSLYKICLDLHLFIRPLLDEWNRPQIQAWLLMTVLAQSATFPGQLLHFHKILQDISSRIGTLFWKGPNSKYSQFCRPSSICCNYLIQLLQHGINNRQSLIELEWLYSNDKISCTACNFHMSQNIIPFIFFNHMEM